jgi:Flp pilus assembly protein TadB
MGGEGSMLSAIVSLKNNRAILKKRKIRELKDILYEVSGKTEVEFKKISHAEFEVLKSQIRKQARKNAQWELFSYVLAFVFVGLFVWLVIWLFH